ncbi:hypothetical protein [Streptomyces glaucus]|uniref:hypothetical protein n=1 Tax=Streptomyces glaucus TaxID=284029 RepID=UPI0031DB271D
MAEKDVADGDPLGEPGGDEPGDVTGGDGAAFPFPAGGKSGERHDSKVEDRRERQAGRGRFPGAVGEDVACSGEQIERVGGLPQPGEVDLSRIRTGVANPAAAVAGDRVSVVSPGS